METKGNGQGCPNASTRRTNDELICLVPCLVVYKMLLY